MRRENAVQAFVEALARQLSPEAQARVGRRLAKLSPKAREQLLAQFVAIIDKHHARAQRRARRAA